MALLRRTGMTLVMGSFLFQTAQNGRHQKLNRRVDEKWRCGDPWMYPIPNPNPNKHWEKCHDIVQKFDEDMYKAWKGEVDNLLIFAGLFSALVTAFATQSYQWLQPSSDDQALQLLAQISMQLSQGLPGNTLSIPISPFTVTASSVRINIFWFLSLTLSMATVLIGILCMQWLREYGRDAARSHKDALAIRQMRYEGLIRWKVPSILSFLPLLLQLAFVLFFAGLLDLLWNLNRLVAIFVTIAVDLVFLVLVGTTVLPALQSHLTKDPYLHVGQCPYKSPQSWAFYRLSLGVVSLYRFCLRWFTKMLAALRKHSPEQIEEEAQEPITLSGLSHFGRTVDVHSDKDWNDYDIRWRFMRDATYIDPDTGEPSEPQDGEDIIHSLRWIDQHFSENLDAVYLVFYCLLELGNAQAAQLVGQLDAEVAYLPELLLPTDSRPSLYEGSQMPDLEIREHIYMVFFWLHRHIHPILHQSYLECSIRLMNVTSRSVPRLALRQSDEDLQGISLGEFFVYDKAKGFTDHECILNRNCLSTFSQPQEGHFERVHKSATGIRYMGFSQGPISKLPSSWPTRPSLLTDLRHLRRIPSLGAITQLASG
ncbi:hypothetical protein CVT26_004234 [Gymnopilus dilepis]|uniref:DUF6535 domain-containing protein n=1 Tax=Gymnopilus dilepis TaxID=231916 RepID=A0A409YMW4_9AGAR|nr:hypothetical protein CVT26_004234 [Gymnopilus dilepis]